MTCLDSNYCTGTSASTPTNAGRPLPCNAGYTWIDTPASSLATCNKCAPGYYGVMPDGVSGCTKCAAGSFSDAKGKGTCSFCPKGTYSLLGATACIACPSGTYGSATGLGTMQCSGLCAAGSYSTYTSGAVGPLACSPCRAGYWGRAGATSDTCSGQCQPGTFSAAGASKCSPCPAGSFTKLYGETDAPGNCSNPGSNSNAYNVFNDGVTRVGSTGFCPNGTYSLAGSDTCLPCDAGSYGDATQQTTSSCVGQCGPGSYAALVPAPELYKLVFGADATIGAVSSACTPCPIGVFGASYGLKTAACDGPCPPGTVVIRTVTNANTGVVTVTSGAVLGGTGCSAISSSSVRSRGH